MFIKDISLQNFRNYKEAEISFAKGINILYGENAQGKTNVVEAIYMLATTKSHRGSFDKEIISFDEDESHISATLVKKETEHRIDMHLRKNKNKQIAIDRLPIRRSGELMGLLNTIIFSPEDLSIIKSGPAERRRFMDMELCQLSRIYFSDLSDYNRVLNQRNNLLRQLSFDKSGQDMLPVWDEQLVKYGLSIIRERERFINILNEIIKKVHGTLTGGKEELSIVYAKNAEEETIADILLAKRDTDIRYQRTQKGPHRDDLEFMIGGMNVRRYGSQGQQRTVALSLKLAEIELVKSMVDDTPILLLDDVMSELDAGRRDALLDAIKETQTIITCTGYDDFIKKQMEINRIYKVTAGTITVENAVF